MRRWLPRRLEHGEEATLVQHLDELRSRLIVGLVAVVPAFAFTFAIHEHIMRWLVKPLPDDKQLVTLGVTEPFTTSVMVSFVAAVAIALPVLLWQAWAFLAPAFQRRHGRVVRVLVTAGTALFASGVAFMHYVVLPVGLDFLTSYNEEFYDIQIRASYYYSFVALMIFGGGLAFLLPIVVLGLVRLRIFTPDRLRRNRRIVWLILLVFGALLPTVDPISLALQVIPLVLLFELSLLASTLMERRWQRAWDEELVEAGAP